MSGIAQQLLPMLDKKSARAGRGLSEEGESRRLKAIDTEVQIPKVCTELGYLHQSSWKFLETLYSGLSPDPAFTRENPPH